MSQTIIKSIIETLSQIHGDASVPKNIRLKMEKAIKVLEDETKSQEVKVDKSLQELDNLDEDPNIPVYTRTQIWNVVSLLESL